MYRKKFFEEYGGFREDVLTEDMEMGMRIKSKHYKIKNAIDAEVYTLAPQKFKDLLRQRTRWYLGGIELAFKEYNFMLFNPKYSVMGLLIFPMAYISVFLALFVFLYALIKQIHNLYLNLYDLSLVNFDIMTMLNNYQPSIKLSPYPILIASILAITLSIIMLYLGKKHTEDDKVKVHMALYYYLVYWILYATWWLTVLFYKFTGKKVKFGNLVWKKGKVYKDKIREEKDEQNVK